MWKASMSSFQVSDNFSPSMWFPDASVMCRTSRSLVLHIPTLLGISGGDIYRAFLVWFD